MFNTPQTYNTSTYNTSTYNTSTYNTSTYNTSSLAQQLSVCRKAYTSDLTDAQWELIASMLVLPEGGRPRTTNMREVFNAIYYQTKNGCTWENLPHDFPPEGTMRRWFHYFKRTGQYEKINGQLREAVRVQAGREEDPSLAIIDSQSTKSTRTSGERGYDMGKKNQRYQTSLPR